nr:D-alanine--D-serine ligase VanG [Maliibacterium massiliense]
MKRQQVAIFFGGCSSEYGVSLQSAHAVITHIDTTRYAPVLVGITQSGDWFHFIGDPSRILQDTWCNAQDATPAWLSASRSERCLLEEKDGRIKRTPIDVALPVIHGKNGEDGTLQGLLELADIPIAGCGTLASALCMDKVRAHALVATAGIPVARYVTAQQPVDREALIAQAQALSYPLFVKPVRAGSSFGITRVAGFAQLAAAIDTALAYDSQIMIEESVEGFEVGCAVMGNDALTIGAVDEIELADGFFDFTEKYTLKTSRIHMPARIAPKKTAEIQRTAARIYRILGCSGFARVDMFLTPQGKIVFNEVNTIPGFTSHSRFPRMMQGVGLSFEAVIERILRQALEEA